MISRSESRDNSQSNTIISDDNQHQTDMTMTARNTSDIQKNRLVFGLNSRTNKTKHDQYAEKRSGQDSQSAISSSFNVALKTNPTQESAKSTNTSSVGGATRASKYGSFYKQEMSTVRDDNVPETREARSSSQDRRILKKSTSINDDNGETDRAQMKSLQSNTRDPSPSSTATKTRRVVRKKSASRLSETSDDEATNNQNEPIKENKIGQKKKISLEITEKTKISTKTPISIPTANTITTTTTNEKTSIPKVMTKEKLQEEKITNNEMKASSQQESPTKNLAKSSSRDNDNKSIQENRNDPTNAIQPPISSRVQFNIPPPPRQTTSSIQSSVVNNAKSRIYDSPKHPNNLGKNSLNSLPNTISSFKPPKQVNVSKAREKWEDGEPFTLANNRRQRNLGKKTLLSSWSVSSLNQQPLSSNSNLLLSNSVQSSTSKSSVKQLLARGSVLERVQQFEKSPSEENLLFAYEDKLEEDREFVSHQFKDTLSTDQQSSKQTYKSRVSLASDGTLNSNQDLFGNRSDNNVVLRRGSLRRQSSQSSTISSSNKIPKFYHPDGKPNTYEIEIQNKNIAACFDKFPDRRAALVGPSRNRNFHAIALACGFSEYYKEPLYIYVCQQLKEMSVKGTSNNDKRGLRTLKKAASFDTGSAALESPGNQKFITCDQFLVCWRKVISSCYDTASRFVHILTLGQRKHLIPEDFVPLLQSVIEDHPGLSFLRAAPDFHMRYIQTVVARIFFCINKSWTGKISLSELRRSNLLPVLSVLSQEEDINQITDYFSYEHFYVIYCKFWTLDQDHDLLISKDDLARHNDAAISSRIIDRIFLGIVSREVARTGKLSYSEFVWFLIAEEDKKHPRSIEYWFRLMDLDGDGFISIYEMEYFYYEQMKRLELMGIEALPFQDCTCKILDLVNPNIANKITLSDLKRSRMTPIFFDTFINLEKYLDHESREFASARDATQDGVVISDWDRYAAEEYELLVSEEGSTTATNDNITTTTVTSNVLDGTSL